MNKSQGLPDFFDKERRLRQLIMEKSRGRPVMVAFSGGVDSSLVLWESLQALGATNVLAVTAASPTSFPGELEEATEFAEHLGVTHMILSPGECDAPSFMSNPKDRCYVCKRIRYGKLKRVAEEQGVFAIFDGTQADDDPEERPGMKAMTELGISAPLQDAGIGKEVVRSLLRAAGFSGLAEKMAQPCLATRIPFGQAITLEALERVKQGEMFLRSFPFRIVRLRDHYPIARIVTDKSGISTIFGSEETRKMIRERLLELGYEHITVDLMQYGRQ